MSPYAVSKLATEQYALAYQQSFGIEVRRLPLLQRIRAGSERRDTPMRRSSRRSSTHCSHGKPLHVHGDGDAVPRLHLSSATVCEVLIPGREVERAAAHPEPVNLAFNTNTPLLELIKVP